VLQIARRAWARNDNAVWAAQQAMRDEPRLRMTLPVVADPDAVARAVAQAMAPDAGV
jgi:urocanate hydratase